LRRHLNKKGQIAVLIAMSFGLMFLLIAMVVNIGFLVAAKINLQNAVDLAAYAGAAQQARYLTEIGKWNYEMRRNYKAMSFDYIIGMNAERTHDDFKKYITSEISANNAHSIPIACATLQRQGVKTPVAKAQIGILCQDALDWSSTGINLTAILQASEQGLTQSSDAWASCQDAGGNCNSALLSLYAASKVKTKTGDLNSSETFKYLNYGADYQNYNRRLIAWATHDYRHMQSRIRGVHFGDISIGKINGTNISGRWLLEKKKTPIVIFKNAPISVAAKVINGYTNLNGPAPTLNQALLLDGQTLKNPIHDAAYTTFKKNLMEVNADSAKLYHLVPSSSFTGGNGPGGVNTMAGGCGGDPECLQFNGPYLRLDNHDIMFYVRYVHYNCTSAGTFGALNCAANVTTQPIANFPVGVAKDSRVWTYYTVVGVADTSNIPFNVFFGSGAADDTTSKNQYLVAVAAARPFGSRIGPFINDKCENLFSGINKSECTTNGLDPLYPFKDPSSPTLYPNFSIKEGSKLGVKISLSKIEYGPANIPPVFGPNPGNQDNKHVTAYAMTSGPESRYRRYTKPTAPNASDESMHDDGFDGANWAMDTKYFENLPTPVHPMGNRDSVIAWNATGTTPAPLHPTVSQNQADYYQGYLAAYAASNPAIKQFSKVNDRTTPDGQEYLIYTFRYPDILQDPKNWDIKGLTAKPKYNQMEKAFANSMAVSEFEISRYILPYKNISASSQQNTSDNDVLNYVVSQANYASNIYSGSGNRDDNSGGGDNKPLKQHYAAAETPDVLGVVGSDVTAEGYTAWRIGTRGYKVKLVNVQELLTKKNDFHNPLSGTYTLPNEQITVDLTKIYY